VATRHLSHVKLQRCSQDYKNPGQRQGLNAQNQGQDLQEKNDNAYRTVPCNLTALVKAASHY